MTKSSLLRRGLFSYHSVILQGCSPIIALVQKRIFEALQVVAFITSQCKKYPFETSGRK